MSKEEPTVEQEKLGKILNLVSRPPQVELEELDEIEKAVFHGMASVCAQVMLIIGLDVDGVPLTGLYRLAVSVAKGETDLGELANDDNEEIR